LLIFSGYCMDWMERDRNSPKVQTEDEKGF
jgi:hypothetical protein